MLSLAELKPCASMALARLHQVERPRVFAKLIHCLRCSSVTPPPIHPVACGNRFTLLCTLPYAQLPRHRVREMARLDLAREAESKRMMKQATKDHKVRVQSTNQNLM